MAFVGRHAIFDLQFDQKHEFLKDPTQFMNLMREVCTRQKATVLREEHHQFGEGCGYSFMIILAESHASCHTWPEHGVATFDIYMCGHTCNPYEAMDEFVSALINGGHVRNRFETRMNRGWVNE